jgi:hypothetical protein
MRTDIAGGPS